MEASTTCKIADFDPNAIIVAEFEYIAQTAFQANEDRARVSNYYFVTAAAAVAAIIGEGLKGSVTANMYWGFSGLFAVLSLVGLLTVLQLARLRAAWADSVRAMNRIKEYCRTFAPDRKLNMAFAWTSDTIPSVTKRKSVAFLLALSVGVVDIATLLAAVFYFGLALGAQPGDPVWVGGGIAVGLVFAKLQYDLYFDWLGKT